MCAYARKQVHFFRIYIRTYTYPHTYTYTVHTYARQHMDMQTYIQTRAYIYCTCASVYCIIVCLSANKLCGNFQVLTKRKKNYKSEKKIVSKHESLMRGFTAKAPCLNKPPIAVGFAISKTKTTQNGQTLFRGCWKSEVPDHQCQRLGEHRNSEFEHTPWTWRARREGGCTSNFRAPRNT